MNLYLIWMWIIFDLIQLHEAYKVTGICWKRQMITRSPTPGFCLPSEEHLNVFEKFGYKDKDIPKDLSQYQPHLLHESSIIRYYDELGVWKYLGSGSYAHVFDGELAGTGERIVIKQFDEQTPFVDVDLECRMLMYLSESAHFPKCYGYLVSGESLSNISLVLEHFTDTENVRSAIPRKDISMYQWMQILEQVIKHLKFMHSKYILHNDVNRGNILIKWIGREPHVYMIDPGLATFRHGKYSSRPTDPERVYKFFDPTSEYFESNPSRDIYGFGYVLLRLDRERHNEDLLILRKWCRQPNLDDRPTTDELIHRLQALKIKYRKLEHGVYYSNAYDGTLNSESEFQKLMAEPIPIIDIHSLTLNPEDVTQEHFISWNFDHSSYKAKYKNATVMVHLYQTNFKTLRQEARINMIAEPFGWVPKFYGLNFHDTFLTDVIMVQEFVEKADTLKDAIKYHSNKWSLEYRQKISCEISKVVLFFHSRNILINNIHPSNILIIENVNYPILKWTDLGESSHSSGDTFLFRSNYQAPEVQAGFVSSFASDVYSVGQIFQDLFKYATNEVTKSCLHKNQHLRPNISEVTAFMCNETR